MSYYKLMKKKSQIYEKTSKKEVRGKNCPTNSEIAGVKKWIKSTDRKLPKHCSK